MTLGAGSAGPTVQAGLRGAAIHRLVAVAARGARGADAFVVADAVLAGGAVRAGVPGALVDVDLTAQARETRPTAAQPPVTVDHAVSACPRGKEPSLQPPSKHFSQKEKTSSKIRRSYEKEVITVGALQHGTLVHFPLAV